MKIKQEFADRYLACYACIEDNGELWISNARYNGLFKYDILREELNYIGIFESLPDGWCGSHGIAKKYEDEIYFFPLMGDSIDIYNIKSKEFNSIKSKGWELRKSPTAAAYKKDNYIYVIMKNEPCCYVVSIDEHKIVNRIEMHFACNLLSPSNKLIEGTVRVDDDIIFPVQGTKSIVFFNLSTKEERIINVNCKKYFRGGITCVGDELILADADNNLVMYNRIDLSNSIVNFEWDGREKEILYIQKIKDDIVVIPKRLGRIAVYNLDDKNIKYLEYHGLSRLDDTIMNWRDIGNIVYANSDLILCPVGIDSFMRIDLDSWQIKPFPIKIEYYYGTDLENKYLIRREHPSDLEKFLYQMI